MMIVFKSELYSSGRTNLGSKYQSKTSLKYDSGPKISKPKIGLSKQTSYASLSKYHI